MNKETMIKDMTAKVNEVLDAKEALNVLLDKIETEQAEDKQSVQELQEQLETAQESLQYVTDLSEATQIRQQIKGIEEQLELTEIVVGAKANTYHAEIVEKAEAFFKVHKSAKFLFSSVDKYFVAHTSIATMQEDKQTLEGITRDINNSFAFVRQVLVDKKVVTMAEANRHFKGTHLGQRDVETELNRYESMIRKYVHELKQAEKI